MPIMRLLSGKWFIHQRVRKYLAFIAAFGLLILYLRIRNEQDCPYDAWNYTQCARTFIENGLTNLRAYALTHSDDIRGYLFPWIIALGARLSQIIPFFDYRFLLSVFTSLTLTVCLPALVSNVCGAQPMGFFRRMVAPVLLLVFFRGLLAYPLSDIWGAGFAILAIYAFQRALATEKQRAAGCFALAALSGFSLGAAYNIRTIYLFLIIAEAVFFLILCILRRETPWLRKLLILIGGIVGFGLVSLPQMLINLWAFGNATFMLISKSGADLFVNQLYDGIYIAKYETFVGTGYPYNGMNFVDPAGKALLQREGMAVTYEFGTGAVELGTIGAYIALVFRHPFDFIGIYARHLFNLIDVRYPNIFVRSFAGNAFVPVLNYSILYAANITLLRKRKLFASLNKTNLWCLLILLIPTVTILPGAIESRFGLMLFLILWVLTANCFRFEDIGKIGARSWLWSFAGYIVFLAIMCGFGGASSAMLVKHPLLY